jgi:mannosyltransferase
MPLSDDPDVIVFNLKKRYTGVSATVDALVPVQMKRWPLGYCGTTLSNGIQGWTVRQALNVSRRPPLGKAFRIWHLRRNHEMLLGSMARDVLRLPIRLVFTSAAQRLHSALPRWLIAKMDAVIATTDAAASFVPNTRAVVPHGIDTERFQPPPDKLQAWRDSGLPGRYGIGLFGRIRPEKGTHVFVDAMMDLLPRHPDFTAVIGGLVQERFRSYADGLLQRIARAGLQDRILFVGEIPAAGMPGWYQRCLIGVACPRYEAFGLTAFEAAACGCAVVCTRVGGFNALLGGHAPGLLVEPESPADLARALATLMIDPRATAMAGQAMRQEVVERFSVEAEARGIGAVYAALFGAESGASLIDRATSQLA